MDHHKFDRLPARLAVSTLLSSRYEDLYRSGKLPCGARPPAWDQRRAGIDTVRAEDGQLVKLFSVGQQSPPAPGWILILRRGNPDQGYEWTLHGFAPAAAPAENAAP